MQTCATVTSSFFFFFTRHTVKHHHIPEQLLNNGFLEIEPYAQRERGRVENWIGPGKEHTVGEIEKREKYLEGGRR